jgi:hypothetical protein
LRCAGVSIVTLLTSTTATTSSATAAAATAFGVFAGFRRTCFQGRTGLLVAWCLRSLH